MKPLSPLKAKANWREVPAAGDTVQPPVRMRLLPYFMEYAVEGITEPLPSSRQMAVALGDPRAGQQVVERRVGGRGSAVGGTFDYMESG